MKLVNCTPHPICLNDGRVFETSGILPRVTATFGDFDDNGVCEQSFGKINGLPDRAPDTLLIVSAIVLSAAKFAGRDDCVAPATGHPETVRNEKGHIVSVPGFVR